MAQKITNKKPASEKRASSRKRIATKKPTAKQSLWQTLKQKNASYLARRPHRSFQLTRRRDYKRRLRLPGYIAFTFNVFSQLGKHKNVYLWMIAVIAVANFSLIGLTSQDTFLTISEVLKQLTQNILQGGWGELVKGTALFATVLSSSLGVQSQTQQVFGILIGLTVWMTTVWLLRAQLAGKTPRLRDGFYNAGAPLIATGIVLFLFALQLLPAVLGMLLYQQALVTDALVNGAVAMMASIVLFLFVLLSVYWITSTAIALVVVTLPGMYPWEAIKIAGDLVIGRRVRILLRFAWLAFFLLLAWILILLPTFLGVSWLQTSYEQLAWIPVVPIILLLMTAATTVFCASYTYLLYRKIVDDDSAPA